MKIRIDRLALVAVWLGSMVWASAAMAAPNRMQDLMEKARTDALAHPGHVRRLGDPVETPQFGPGTSVMDIDAYAFQGANNAGDQFGDDGNGYRFLMSTTSGGYMAAPVHLPSGVTIDALSLSWCAGPSGGLTMGLYDGQVFGQPITLIGSLTTSGVGSCSTETDGVGSSGYLYTQNQDHPLYMVIHWEGPFDGSLKFNSAAISYHLVVSPAPGTATFADVPTNHPFFQFVEALASSGITAGCGSGNFCPDQPLTRGQMAVFLAKALGLNWPN